MSHIKLLEAIQILKPNQQCSFSGRDDDLEGFFNNIKWVTGVQDNGNAIISDTPPAEITWEKIQEEMDKLDG